MDLAKFIDHTLLKADATAEDIVILCGEAAEYHFAAVCVNPVYVDLAAHVLAGTGVKVATVVGFPLGAVMPAVKVFEAREAIIRKADELDMVMSIGAAKSGQWQAVEEDIKQVVAVAEGETGQSHYRSGAAFRSGKAAGMSGRSGSGRRLCQDFHRFWARWGHGGGCSSPERDGGRESWS